MNPVIANQGGDVAQVLLVQAVRRALAEPPVQQEKLASPESPVRQETLVLAEPPAQVERPALLEPLAQQVGEPVMHIEV